MKRIKIELLSDLLTATGESTAFVSGAPVFDQYGLPYIKGKTFKGLLKEATLEVLEIKGLHNKLADELYGSDTLAGSIEIDNLRISGYETVVRDIKRTEITRSDCISYLTRIRRQTAVEETAKKGSLRTYKLIKKGIVSFETSIRYPESFNDLVQMTLLQLRYIGLRRNRGFGKVRITEIETIPQSKNDLEIGQHRVVPDSTAILEYTLRALAPLHIAKPVGDQNTEGTENYIPGSAIRGIVAGYFMRQAGFENKLHLNPRFRALVLEDVIYTNAYLDINGYRAEPMPFAIGYRKTEQEEKRQAINVIDAEVGSVKNYPPWTCDIFEPHGNAEVNLTQHFHHRRANRLAGMSTEEEGAIFYYESIAEDQTFKGAVIGPPGQLEIIKSILEMPGHAVGSSKATQYGKVSFQCSDLNTEVQELDIQPDQEFYLVLQSNLIIYNDNGFPEPTFSQLKRELCTIGLDPVEEAVAAKVLPVEGFYKPWNANTDMDFAYSMGSTFKIRVIAPEKLKGVRAIGERQSEGFGQFKLYANLTCNKPRKNEIIGALVDTELTQPVQEEMLCEFVKSVLAYKRRREKDNEVRVAAIEQAILLRRTIDPHNKGEIKNHRIKVLAQDLAQTDFLRLDQFEKLLSDNRSKALEQGKKEDKLAKALNSDLQSWKVKRPFNEAVFNEFKEKWFHVFNYLRVRKDRNKKDN